jgi:hypothetical protein
MASVNGWAVYTDNDGKKYDYYAKRDLITAGGGTPKDGPEGNPYMRVSQSRSGRGLKPRKFNGRTDDGKNSASFIVATKSKADQINKARKVSVKGKNYNGRVSSELKS